MDELSSAILEVLWIEYGEFQGFIPDDEIELKHLLNIKSACEIAIREKLKEFDEGE